MKGHDEYVPVRTPLKVLLKHIQEKRHSHEKDSIRDMVRLKDKPRTRPGHYKDTDYDNKNTKRTNEDKPRTS